MPEEDAGTSYANLGDFLANAPPGSSFIGAKIFDFSGATEVALKVPTLTMYCNGTCEGERPFDGHSQSGTLGQFSTHRLDFLTYICRTCRMGMVIMPVAYSRDKDNAWVESASIEKIGQSPPFGPVTPSRLLRLIQSDSETFLKGRRSESLGLGIGAFAYYRRVVENQRSALIDAMIKVANRTNSKPEFIQALQKAKSENQFKKSVEDIKDAVPEVLKINGYNPMLLLHNALSAGIHSHSDEDCLKIAQDIRTVLVAFSDRIGQALKDQQEIEAAVNRLANSRPSSKPSAGQ